MDLTDYEISFFLLTMNADELIESEIPLQTRIILPKIFQRAYQAADQLVSENKILQCPSAQVGHLRTWASDYALAQAIESGELPVEDYSWEWYVKPTGQYLQIYTKKAVLTVNQLQDVSKRPRDAKFRENASYNNQPYLFPELEPPKKAVGKAHLIIAHGYHALAFIHIGMPSPDDAGFPWLGLTKNILDEIYVVSNDTAPVEAEDIKPVLTIKESIKKKISKYGN